MNRLQLETLRLAVDGVALPDITHWMSRNVAECRGLSRVDTQKCKTKPNPTAPDGGADMHGLAPRQRVAVEKLVAGRSVAATARELGVERRTVFRWKKNARFQQAIDHRIEAMSRFVAECRGEP